MEFGQCIFRNKFSVIHEIGELVNGVELLGLSTYQFHMLVSSFVVGHGTPHMNFAMAKKCTYVRIHIVLQKPEQSDSSVGHCVLASTHWYGISISAYEFWKFQSLYV